MILRFFVFEILGAPNPSLMIIYLLWFLLWAFCLPTRPHEILVALSSPMLVAIVVILDWRGTSDGAELIIVVVVVALLVTLVVVVVVNGLSLV
jgi:hypothetical protein